MPGLDGQLACIDAGPVKAPVATHVNGLGPDPSVGAARLLPLPSVVDAGEVFVGADQWVPISMLMPTDGYTGYAWLISTIERDSKAPRDPLNMWNLPDAMPLAFHPDTQHGPLRPVMFGASPVLFRVRLNPRSPGFHSERVILQVRWADGNSARQTITLLARAKAWEHGSAPAVPEPSSDAIAPDGSRDQLLSDGQAFKNASAEAVDLAAMVARNQETGRDTAEKESKSYSEKPPATPMWVQLAELAVSLGVSAIAGGLSKSVAGFIFKGLKVSAEDVTKLHSFTGTADAVKDAMKRAGNASINGFKRKAARPNAHRAAADHDGTSSNPIIAFWADQRLMLADLELANKTELRSIIDSYGGELSGDPKGAAAKMRGIAYGLREAADGAHDVQARTSLSQWVSGLTRDRAGNAMANVEQVEVPVTDMTAYLENSEHVSEQGLLRMAVDIRHTGDEIDTLKVTEARWEGVSREVTKRFAKAPLAQGGVPIRMKISVNGSFFDGGTLTRDEAGRLRFNGHFDGVGSAAGSGNELESLPFAQKIVDRVIHLSLDDMQVHVKDDDATGDGDQKGKDE